MVSILFLSSFKQNCSASFCDSVSEALNKKRMLVEESPHNDSFLPNILAAHLHAEKTFCLIIWWFLGFCLGHSTGDSGGHSECTEWCSAGTWTWGCKDSRKCGRSTDTRTAHGTLIIVRYAIVVRRLYGTLFYLTTLHNGQITFSWWLWNPLQRLSCTSINYLLLPVLLGNFPNVIPLFIRHFISFQFGMKYPFFLSHEHKSHGISSCILGPWLCTFDKHMPSKSITTTSNMMCTFW